MAFMGIFLFFVIIGIVGFLLLMTIVFLIIGIVMKKKKKSGSTVLFVLSGICIAIPVAIVLFFILPKRVEIETPGGVAEVWNTEIDDIRGLVKESRETGEIDVEAVKKIVSKNPKLIYYTDYYYVSFEDYPTLLEWAVFYEEFELADFLMENGAIFDNSITYNKLLFDSSLESYFDYTLDKKDRISFETIDFMAENGAEFKDILLSSYLYRHIFNDGQVKEDDREIIKYLIEKGADINAVNSQRDTPVDVIEFQRDINDRYIESNDYYYEIINILGGK